MVAEKKPLFSFFEFTSSTLHVLAMFCMLLDHIWASFPHTPQWMTCVGRIAFPIFAFLVVEGYYHTHNLKKYLLRLLVFAVISEIPFNLMYGGTLFYPFHQNVLWTLLMGLSGIALIEKAKKKKKLYLTVLVSVLVSALGFLLGMVTFVDYFGLGVLTVLMFYFLRGRNWWNYIAQFLALLWINQSFAGNYYPVTIFGIRVDFYEQYFALLSLIPLWLYHGKKGLQGKAFQIFCYAFYPAHALLIYIVAVLL